MTQQTNIPMVLNAAPFRDALGELLTFKNEFQPGSEPEFLLDFLGELLGCLSTGGLNIPLEFATLKSCTTAGAVEILLEPGSRFLECLTTVRAFDFDSITHRDTP